MPEAGGGMKIFLTGASGLVGAAFARAAQAAGLEVTGTVFRQTAAIPGTTRSWVLDLTDEAATSAALRAADPQVIVNCAAVAEPAACLADPAGSAALNVRLPELLARHGVRLIHLSSEQVFDGTQSTPYTVNDIARPLNLYGEQKLAGEQAVLAIAPMRSAVVRLPLLTGDSATRRRSLHERLLLDWSEGRTPRLFTDEYRQTCSAANVAGLLLALCTRKDVCGLRHWAGAELISRHEIGRRMREYFRLDESVAPLVAVERAAQAAVAAVRPACLALAVEPLAHELGLTPQGFAAQLAELTVPPAITAWHRDNCS
jgi:dTDP-4-dehydrorhamnose reductase